MDAFLNRLIDVTFAEKKSVESFFLLFFVHLKMKSASNVNALRLVTFPISHFCEKARWALEYCAVAFVEEAVGPGFHSSRTKGHTVPTLILLDGKMLHESSEIAAFASRAAKDALIPVENREQMMMCASLDEEFTDLGVNTRRYTYFFLLHNEPLAISMLGPENIPSPHRWAVQTSFGPIKEFIMSKFEVSREGADEARVLIKATFDSVSQLLSDGRKFLLGDDFSLADIAFCSLAAPVIAPPEVPSYERCFQAFPEDHEFRQFVDELRETRAGEFVLSTYKKMRSAKVKQ